jgi:hypothetical protein
VSLPKVETVNVVTMDHGRKFVQQLFSGVDIGEACDETEILKWPGDDADEDPTNDETEGFHLLTKDICRRLRAAIGDQIAETFVRVANAAIDAERLADDTELTPPRVQTVPIVTVEHAETFVEDIHRHLIDTGGFVEAFHETHIMEWPDDDKVAQKHFEEMVDEIRDHLFEETRPVIVEAFVRIASDVTSRERSR